MRVILFPLYLYKRRAGVCTCPPCEDHMNFVPLLGIGILSFCKSHRAHVCAAAYKKQSHPKAHAAVVTGLGRSDNSCVISLPLMILNLHTKRRISPIHQGQNASMKSVCLCLRTLFSERHKLLLFRAPHPNVFNNSHCYHIRKQV